MITPQQKKEAAFPWYRQRIPIIGYFAKHSKIEASDWRTFKPLKSNFIFTSPTIDIFVAYTGWNYKIVVLKKTTLQLYFKTFIEKINSANLIM